MTYNMPTLLWIDDIRDPRTTIWRAWIENHFGPTEYNVTWVKSYDECISWLSSHGLPDNVSFDHDLGDIDNPDGEKTGYDCCKYMVDMCLDNSIDFPRYQIQSDNGPGRQNIDMYIKNFKKHFNKL